LLPDSKGAENVEIDGGKAISWSQSVDSGRKDGFYPLYDQVLKLYDGTKTIEVTKIESGSSIQTQSAAIKSFVLNNQVVWVKSIGYGSPELYLYDGGKTTKIAEGLGLGSALNFGIDNDRVFYQANLNTGTSVTLGSSTNVINSVLREYQISTGVTKSIYENSPLGKDDFIYNLPDIDGKNSAWVQGKILAGMHGIYLEDGTTRVNLQDPTPGTYRAETIPRVSGSNVVFAVVDVSGKSVQDLYLLISLIFRSLGTIVMPPKRSLEPLKILAVSRSNAQAISANHCW
jgi:hypothetical protein